MRKRKQVYWRHAKPYYSAYESGEAFNPQKLVHWESVYEHPQGIALVHYDEFCPDEPGELWIRFCCNEKYYSYAERGDYPDPFDGRAEKVTKQFIRDVLKGKYDDPKYDEAVVPVEY